MAGGDAGSGTETLEKGGGYSLLQRAEQHKKNFDAGVRPTRQNIFENEQATLAQNEARILALRTKIATAPKPGSTIKEVGEEGPAAEGAKVLADTYIDQRNHPVKGTGSTG